MSHAGSSAMNGKPTNRERLLSGMLFLLAIYAAAWLKLSGNADRANEWLIGLWPF